MITALLLTAAAPAGLIIGLIHLIIILIVIAIIYYIGAAIAAKIGADPMIIWLWMILCALIALYFVVMFLLTLAP
jgi:hypothetical protein